jgi:hypothetical protein
MKLLQPFDDLGVLAGEVVLLAKVDRRIGQE